MGMLSFVLDQILFKRHLDLGVAYSNNWWYIICYHNISPSDLSYQTCTIFLVIKKCLNDLEPSAQGEILPTVCFVNQFQ